MAGRSPAPQTTPQITPPAVGSTTLTVPTGFGLADGGASNGGVWVTAPQSARHRWEKCPHHDGQCPGCGEAVKDAAALKAARPLRVSKALSAADPGLARALDRLLDLADDDDHADLAMGGAQQLFRRLKNTLPEAVLKPPPPKAKSCWQRLVWAFSRPKPPGNKPLEILERAMQAHRITGDCLAQAKGLPLDGGATDASAPTRRRLAAFLILLAEQLHGGAARLT
jgi:hypothetical protein